MKRILFILLLFSVELLQAQPFYFRRYQVEDGLSNNAVLSSLQDKKGFMWFGTKDGLNRFDGYTFKIYRHDPDDPNSLGGSFILCIYEDKDGVLRIGTERGLYTYHPSTETFSHVKGSLKEDVKTMHMDKHHNLWYIAGLGIYKYDVVHKTIKAYPKARFFEATSICEDDQGTLWFSTADGFICSYDAVKDDFKSYYLFNHSRPAPSNWIEKIFYAGKGQILIGTSNQGVKRFNTLTHTYEDVLIYNIDQTEIYARDFVRVSESEVWIATESGIFIVNNIPGKIINLKKQVNDPYSLSDNAIYSFLKDREGGIWATTYFGGISYYAKPYALFEKFFYKKAENSISGNAVREICPDNRGNLWIGTEDAGLNKLNVKTGNISNFKPDGLRTSIINSNIHGLLAVGNELWIGTFEHGLDVMDLKTEKVIRHYNAGTGANDLKSNFIYSFYKTMSGQILIATTKGLYTYNRSKDNFDPVAQVPDYIFYTSIMQDSTGMIWLGTIRDGLYYYHPVTGRKGFYTNDPKNKKSLIDNRVNRVMVDSRKNLWITTESGLCRLNPATHNFDRYTISDGLPSNVTYSIQEDKASNLWISTSKGLFRFNPVNKEFKTFRKSDGLTGDQFNYNSSYKDGDGQMYFGTVNGLIRFNPANFVKDTFIPPVYITGFQVNTKEAAINAKDSPLSQSILTTQSVVLSSTQSSFSIDFAALSYTSPIMTEYAYKMEGIDHDWIYLKQNRKVYFTNLSAGKYRFRVKASNSSGIWNSKETVLDLEIRPPYLASTTALTIYTLILSAMIFFVIREYHKWIERKNARRMAIFENEKEREIYQAKIEFFTNVAHEIRTPLTLIKGPMEKVIKRVSELPDMEKNLRIMNKNTDRLLNLTNQLLDFRKTETSGFSLNFVKANLSETIKDMIEDFQILAEQKDILLELKLQEDRLDAYVDLEAFHKIMSNLIDNALKYGESHTVVELLRDENKADFLKIKVKNDGKIIPYELHDKIFEPFFRAKEAEIRPGTGIGLPLSRALAELHKGQLLLEIDQDGFNIFVLMLPIHQLIEFNLKGKWKKI
ncbi:ligand-binding sensor domain-containing protein [Pedobacter metabolipauper]|uniref:histidine kinase n=1 Tax=Pedobacter metabolipauper TaxID=425513 RepID=A0A4R6SZQ3_9SPHI|nr:sensor histidine kinase [Pedobacter metabolipauper]TDQ11582.1 signal transduction histidine kinase [Pedobacter metabolipauper]